jgi:anti-anti-sigma regulatory factor
MLRITRVADHDERRLLKLEGKLMGPWVNELERVCAETSESPVRVSLDLAAVRFVDQAGVNLLRGLLERGVRLAACSRFIAELLHRESR